MAGIWEDLGQKKYHLIELGAEMQRARNLRRHLISSTSSIVQKNIIAWGFYIEVFTFMQNLNQSLKKGYGEITNILGSIRVITCLSGDGI